MVNGAVGTVISIYYERGGSSDLPLAVMVKFDNCTGPTFTDQTVPITPVRRTYASSAFNCSQLQIPLKLAWAVTIHKAQGLTLDKVVIDIGNKEFSSGLTYVACSRVRSLKDLLFTTPFSYERLSNLSKSKHLRERIQEEHRLRSIEQSTVTTSTNLNIQDTITPPFRVSDQATMTPSTSMSTPSSASTDATLPSISSPTPMSIPSLTSTSTPLSMSLSTPAPSSMSTPSITSMTLMNTPFPTSQRTPSSTSMN